MWWLLDMINALRTTNEHFAKFVPPHSLIVYNHNHVFHLQLRKTSVPVEGLRYRLECSPRILDTLLP